MAKASASSFGVVLVAGLLALTACGHASARLLNSGGRTVITVSMPDAPANRPYTFTDMRLCLDQPGQVEVVDAKVLHPRGLVVRRFATRGRPARISPTHRSVWRTGFDRGRQLVSTTCSGRSGHTPIGLEVYRRPRVTGLGDGVVVRYRSGDGIHRMVVPLQVTRCEPEEATTRNCYSRS
jgi:hypothetical protein